MAASATPIQNGCSPWSARCSDQLTVTSVRRAAISAASASIAAGSTSQIARGPRGVAAHAVARAREIGLELVPAGAAGAQERLVVRPGGEHQCASPSISATSVLGRGAIQRAAWCASTSPRTGPTLTKSTPAARAACCALRARWRASRPS